MTQDTSRGYAVFLVDYRSGVISGWEAVEAARRSGEFAKRDNLDVMSGTQALIKAGIADAQRLAIVGHSAGGLTGSSLITQTSMYSAAVLHEGWADWLYSSTTLAPLGSEIQDWQFGGAPWEVPDDRHLRNSPASAAKNITTPTFFATGSLALGAPGKGYGWQYLAASMRRRGVDVEYLIYQGEGHVFTDPNSQLDFIVRATEWIGRHIS